MILLTSNDILTNNIYKYVIYILLYKTSLKPYRTLIMKLFFKLYFCFVVVNSSAEFLFYEQFLDGKIKFIKDASLNNWVQSTGKTYGSLGLSNGKFYADKIKSRGLKTLSDAHFYANSLKLPTPFKTKGSDIILQFSVRFINI